MWQDCTPYTIKAAALRRQIVLSEIQRVSAEAREHWDELFQRLTSSHQSRAKKELAAKQRELDKGERRLKDLETLFRRSFEELALGHLSNGQFQMLVREFVERIEVHERSGRYKKKHYTQQVDIYFNFIGQA